MKRKFFSILIICILPMVLITSCNARSEPLESCGEEVIALMVEMIESEDYRSLYNISSAYDEKIYKLREGDYSKISNIYELSIPEEELLDTSVNKEAFSEELYKYICSSAYISFSTRVNQASGVEALAVSSIFSAQKSFVNKDVDANKIYLYVFENGCPIAVTFTANGNNAFKANGNFLVSDTFAAGDAYSIIESCEALGIENVTVSEK